MKIPTDSEWGVIEKDNLDAQSAFEHFAGISLQDAKNLFREHALYYQEDLLSMPPVAFNCYAPVFAGYLLSSDAKSDADGASSFFI